MRPGRTRLLIASSLLLAGAGLIADGTRFSDYTPLASSAAPTDNEAAPITFGNPDFEQESIADRESQLADGKPNTGDWDMITLNETGHDKGRYLFTVFESDQSGVQRHDLVTGKTETIWMSPEFEAHVSFDPSFWTPWGTFVTAEEDWCTSETGCTSNIHGRLFELRNPLDAPGITEPLTPESNDFADFVHQNVIPRTAHEGIQWDKAGNMYFIDELNGGNLYKYVTAADFAKVKNGQEDYFAAGQTFVLRVGDGNTPNATGSYVWVPITDENGDPLPGALTITDPNSVTSVDARNTTNLTAFKGTDYQRPEDMQIQTLQGREYLYVDDDHDQPGVPARSQESEDLGLRRSEHHRSGDRSSGGLGAGERRQPRGRRRRQHLHRRGLRRRRGRRHLATEGSEQRR